MSLAEDPAPAGLFGLEFIMGGDNVPAPQVEKLTLTSGPRPVYHLKSYNEKEKTLFSLDTTGCIQVGFESQTTNLYHSVTVLQHWMNIWDMKGRMYAYNPLQTIPLFHCAVPQLHKDINPTSHNPATLTCNLENGVLPLFLFHDAIHPGFQP